MSHEIKDKYEDKILLLDPDILKHPSNAKLLELSTKLQHLKNNLSERFGSLSIQESISQDGVPFLHIWKPIRKASGVQGMPFLPCFHIIVTLTSNGRLDDTTDLSTNEKALFQLHSYHGKVLADESISLSACDKNADYNLISRMAEDSLRMCRGIEDISGVKFAQFVKSCDLQMLSKIRSVLLIEQFMGEVVLRSRLCEFALYHVSNDIEGNLNNDLFRCDECNAILNDDAIQDDYADFSDGLNVFQRVYNETSVSDLESMAIFQQMYEQSSKPIKLKRKKKKLKQSNINVKTEPKVDINIKTEPEDSYGMVSSGDAVAVHPQTQFGEHFMAHGSGSGGISDGNKIVKAEIKDGAFEHNSQSNTGGEENGNVWMSQPSGSDDDDIDVDDADSKHKNMMDYNELDSGGQYSKRQMKDAEKDRKKVMRNQRNEEKEKRRIERKQKRKDEKAKREEKKKMEPPFNETCVICLYNYRSFQNFNRDKIRHEQVLSNLMDPVTCPLCNSTIPTKYQVTSHFEEFHSENNVTCCCECLELIPKGSDRLRRHILQVHHSATEKRVCQDCGRECSTKQALEVHIAGKDSLL